MLQGRRILFYCFKSVTCTKNKGFRPCFDRLAQKNRDVLMAEVRKHAACGEVMPPEPFIQAKFEWQMQH
jgi:hypothetical protein